MTQKVGGLGGGTDDSNKGKWNLISLRREVEAESWPGEPNIKEACKYKYAASRMYQPHEATWWA